MGGERRARNVLGSARTHIRSHINTHTRAHTRTQVRTHAHKHARALSRSLSPFLSLFRSLSPADGQPESARRAVLNDYIRRAVLDAERIVLVPHVAVVHPDVVAAKVETVCVER